MRFGPINHRKLCRLFQSPALRETVFVLPVLYGHACWMGGEDSSILGKVGFLYVFVF